MGLCKCPKRKVTNLFCFEHRVNVCEHCLVSNHNKCIVQSYLQWLQDSDYNPNCRLCNNPLISQDTVRLVCYARLPLHTAPAGYQCPNCQGPVFPPSNLASPIADMLREQLSLVNWARAGLGLPLIEEPVEAIQDSKQDVTDYADWSTFDALETTEAYPTHSYTPSPSPAPTLVPPPVQEDHGHLHNNGAMVAEEQHSGVNMITATTTSTPRKVYDTRDSGPSSGHSSGPSSGYSSGHSSVTQIDFDDDKYRRRPALSWFAQILKTGLSWKQRVFMLLLVGVLGFFTLIIIMAKLGRASADSDPNLDPLLNPNIRVGKN
ncbi:unnamed protein product [Coregonus sp. 'balchen']|nr:unnamed protein product [Coregonus sp. 'balchen']